MEIPEKINNYFKCIVAEQKINPSNKKPL